MEKFTLTLYRTETHKITDEIEAESLEEAKQIMSEKECDGHYDLDDMFPRKWDYVSGQVDNIT